MANKYERYSRVTPDMRAEAERTPANALPTLNIHDLIKLLHRMNRESRWETIAGQNEAVQKAILRMMTPRESQAFRAWHTRRISEAVGVSKPTPVSPERTAISIAELKRLPDSMIKARLMREPYLKIHFSKGRLRKLGLWENPNQVKSRPRARRR